MAFNWDDFKLNRVVVYCKSKEESDIFIEECNKNGIFWQFPKVETRWFDGCFYSCKNFLLIGKLNSSNRKEYYFKGVDFMDIKMNGYDDLEVYDVVLVKGGYIGVKGKSYLYFPHCNRNAYKGFANENQLDFDIVKVWRVIDGEMVLLYEEKENPEKIALEKQIAEMEAKLAEMKDTVKTL